MEISFNCKVYSRSAIYKAIEDFNEIADFTVVKKGRYYSIKARNYDTAERGKIRGNLLNYVLMLSRQL